MTCDDVLNNGLVFMDVYICIFVMVRFEFELYIYVVRFEFELFFFAEKSTAGAVLDTVALTEVHYRGD